MCRHIFNVKVFIQASCCGQWFDCSECHDDTQDHPFKTEKIIRLQCKTCNRIFQRDMTMFMESDRFCEQCNEKWVIPGVTPESSIYCFSRDQIHSVLTATLEEALQK